MQIVLEVDISCVGKDNYSNPKISAKMFVFYQLSWMMRSDDASNFVLLIVPSRYFCGGSFCFMSWCLKFWPVGALCMFSYF